MLGRLVILRRHVLRPGRSAGWWAQDCGGRRAGPSHDVLLYDTADIEVREAGRSEVRKWEVGGQRVRGLKPGGRKAASGRFEVSEWEVGGRRVGGLGGRLKVRR